MEYKKRLESIKEIKDHQIMIDELIKFNEEIVSLEINNYDSYYLVIDSLMLLGIEYYLVKNNKEANYYFNKVVELGEKYKDYSKDNYYDIINCAYSWLVYYAFEDKDFDTVNKYCNIVLRNYSTVKDDPNYYVTEKESVDICKKYLDALKKNS